jgi:alkanesulfonate monooxygenase SsuD/methylene tetrahydromethanopterin reductase-like flavin-dependent oxidoreductase (luciferase family)
MKLGIGLPNTLVPDVNRGLFLDWARAADHAGFHSFGTIDRPSHDDWEPLISLAAAAAVTERVRLATTILQMPNRNEVLVAKQAAVIDRLSGGRLDLGIGLGHRDVEFDTLGVRRDRRGRRMDAALDVFAAQPSFPPIWVGGMAARALERAGERGHNVLLPQTLRPDAIRRAVETVRAHDGWNGTVGAMRDLWIEPDPVRARQLRERFRRFFLEEAGWWVLKGKPAFSAPEELEGQMARVVDSALIGSPDEVAHGLRTLVDAGAEFLCLRINFDMVEHAELRDQVHRVAEELPPLLADVLAPAGAAR